MDVNSFSDLVSDLSGILDMNEDNSRIRIERAIINIGIEIEKGVFTGPEKEAIMDVAISDHFNQMNEKDLRNVLESSDMDSEPTINQHKNGVKDNPSRLTKQNTSKRSSDFFENCAGIKKSNPSVHVSNSVKKSKILGFVKSDELDFGNLNSNPELRTRFTIERDDLKNIEKLNNTQNSVHLAKNEHVSPYTTSMITIASTSGTKDHTRIQKTPDSDVWREISVPESFIFEDIGDILSNDFNAKTVADSYTNCGLAYPPFLHFCQALAAVESTPKRLAKQNILINLLLTFIYHDKRQIGLDRLIFITDRGSPVCLSSVLVTVLLAGNNGSDGLSLNIGGSAISSAVCSALSCSKSLLHKRAGDAGELGDAAAQIFEGEGDASNNKHQRQTKLLNWTKKAKPLSLGDVMKCLLDLDNLCSTSFGENKGIEKRRRDTIVKLLTRARHREEIRFAIKILCSHIRTGATLITLLTCLATAVVLHQKGLTQSMTYEKMQEVKFASIDLDLETGATCNRVEETSLSEIDTSMSDGVRCSTLKNEVLAAQERLRLVFSRHANLKSVVDSLVRGGFVNLIESCPVQVGIPLHPMLASPSCEVQQVVEHYHSFHEANQEDSSRLTPFFAAEYKYDGQRIQMHYDRKSLVSPGMILYSRNLEDVTAKFQTVCEWMLSKIPEDMSSFIIDVEICALKHVKQWKDAEKLLHVESLILPFQVMATMKRKKIDQDCQNAHLCIFAFDLLFLNGNSFVDAALIERRNKLQDMFASVLQFGYFHFTRSIDLYLESSIRENSNKVESFLREAIGDGRCEGLMLKSLQSKYDGISREIGGGMGGWRKLKKDYIDDLADSIDVVPIGAWRGSGRKSKWFSPFLLAVLDKNTGEWQSLCRCMSGFTDEFYQTKFDQFSPCIVPQKPGDVSTEEQVPFWFDPWKISEVWEIRGADLTLSPVHHTARGYADGTFESGRGIALRFPRFIRVRNDKSIEQCSTSEDVLSLFAAQSQRL